MVPSWVIRPAEASDASTLSELAVRSKGYWGYDQAFLDACRAELRIEPSDCAGDDIRVAESAGTPVAFARLSGAGQVVVLDALFVDPPFIGRGVGRALLDDALDRARGRGATVVTLDADPDAEPFYLAAGAVRVGESPSGSIPGRVLPRLEFRLGSAR